MKRQFLLCYFLISYIFLSAQDIKPPREKYFFLGVGLPFMTVRDEAHSPLKYQGFAPTLRIGFENINGDYISRMTISAAFGTAKPKTRPKPKGALSGMGINNIQFNYTYYSILNTYNQEGWNRYVGGAATLTFDVRAYNLPSNNLMGYQVNLSLNAGGFIQKQISERKHFNYEAFTPLVSYSLRPTYLGMLPMKGSDINPKYVFSNGQIVTVNRLFRLYNRFAYDQQIKSYRVHRYFYSWDYHSNTISKPLKSVIGGVGYESLFKM